MGHCASTETHTPVKAYIPAVRDPACPIEGTPPGAFPTPRNCRQEMDVDDNENTPPTRMLHLPLAAGAALRPMSTGKASEELCDLEPAPKVQQVPRGVVKSATPSSNSLPSPPYSSIPPASTTVASLSLSKVDAAAARLCLAAARGNLAQLESLLKKGLDINTMDYDKRTALHLAAAEGNSEIVDFLLKRGADTRLKDRWGQTPMDEARRAGHHTVLAVLRAAHGAEDELEVLREVHTPTKVAVQQAAKLCSAAAAGAISSLESLIASGANVSAADYDGRTPLHVAAAKGKGEAAAWLIKAGANIFARDNFGRTPLDEAIRSKSDEIVKMLVAHGAVDLRVGRAGTLAEIADLRQSSTTEEWAVQASEVTLGKRLSTTIKSDVFVATWRGTKCVAKMVKNVQNLSRPASRNEGLAELGMEDSTHARAMEEMLHEIRTLSTLRHPDLVLFLGACLDSSPCFFLTEFMEGGDLETHFRVQSQKLGRVWRPALGTIIQWASAVARALSFLHACSRPIIHRDLKPLNLLLTRNQELKVADFGLSKMLNPLLHPGGLDTSPAPHMSGGVGTYRYMAPEVARYEHYTDRIDVYSFGLILYFMCSGRQPFHEFYGGDPEQVLKAFTRGEEPRPTLNTTIATAELRKLMMDAWHPKPQCRPAAQECVKRMVAVAEALNKPEPPPESCSVQ